MKKRTIITALVVSLIAIFALPTAADANCNAGVDYHAQGRQHIAAGDWGAALASANCGISLTPDNYQMWMLKAMIHCHFADFDNSIPAYTQAIELRPDSAYAYSNRGWAKGRAGDLDGAMVDLNYAIELDEDMAYAYNNRGLTWHRMGEMNRAQADYQRAIDLGLQEPWAEINLYNLQFEMAKLADA